MAVILDIVHCFRLFQIWLFTNWNFPSSDTLTKPKNARTERHKNILQICTWNTVFIISDTFINLSACVGFVTVSNLCINGNCLFKSDSVASSERKKRFSCGSHRGKCLAVNSLHRGMAQAISWWALTAISRVLTWVSAYGSCGKWSGAGTGCSSSLVSSPITCVS